MNIRVFKTLDGMDVLANVIEQQEKYFLVSFPLNIIDNPMQPDKQYITKWMRYTDSDKPIKIYMSAIASEGEANKVAQQQYIDLIEGYKKYLDELVAEDGDEVSEDGEVTIDTEGLTDEEAKQKLYGRVLQFVKKPEGSKEH